ncbi:tagaturonate reductase [Persicobacter psychrovividus]|uniref:Altronate oxidoreductase n=1 Tax=Persicobacter psychrovividus TaxID=387638 RepID=A0ABM7VMW5_9BACT|nr:altronate oxidoreductase [Persicobacter psychrovividus]
MKALKRDIKQPNRPVKVVQFGEGNFLRAFVDWVIQRLNEETDFNGNVAVVQPLPEGMLSKLAEQDGLYHVMLQGISQGELKQESHLIDSLSEFYNPYQDFDAYEHIGTYPELQFVFSNTTEAGITVNENDKMSDQAAVSFPGKLTHLLYRRYQAFDGAKDKGLYIIPCELINHNGQALKEALLKYADLWALGEGYKRWLISANHFCNTLVDRIVPGFPKDNIDAVQKKIGYQDQMVVEGEIFHLWVIEADAEVQTAFPADKIGVNMIYTQDQQPYRNRKVHILNGAHTSMVPVGLLAGISTVQGAVEDQQVGKFIVDAVEQEIIPTLSLPKDELLEFAAEVMDRFRNPFVKHYLSSIALNAFPKYKTRVLPCVKTYFEQQGTLPYRLVLALSAYIHLYNSEIITLKDDAFVIDLLAKAWKADDMQRTAFTVLSCEQIWGEDLSVIDGLLDMVSYQLELIQTNGIAAAIKAPEAVN